MSKPRYLTKSRFKFASECPTKLFYSGKSAYADQSTENSFLAALAEGGFQVGALARAYYPEGHHIETLDGEEALEQTNKLLAQDNVTIFEAAVLHDNLFIRIDILRKQGNVIDLIEVKAKSFDTVDDFVAKRSGKVSTPWKPYILDVAFQEHVLGKAFPNMIVRSKLMLADKNALTSVEGLNQKFVIGRDQSGRGHVQCVGDVSSAALGDPILIEVDVAAYTHELLAESYNLNGATYSFADYVDTLAGAYNDDVKIAPTIDCGVCAKCQFTATPGDEAEGRLSGYKECWAEAKGFNDVDFEKPNVLDIWNFRKKQEFLEEGCFLMQDLSEDNFDLDKPSQARQWLQIQKTVAQDVEPYFDVEGLREAVATWTYPLHFIDFETSTVAVPFNTGRRPYETVAFQFSHHVVSEEGRVEHVDEYINVEPGKFPNFEFVRRLKASLEKDEGTIFRYAVHENTVLNHIREQLENSDQEIADRTDLIDWIMSVTEQKLDDKTQVAGVRNMVDLLELVKDHYYQLDMGGSNSIKAVLPAILNNSKFLQKKYSEPIYRGRNFSDQTWIQLDDSGRVRDPYKLLPPVFADVSQDELDKIETEETLADGGAAMTAYARMQFTAMPDEEREATRKALLRYCELDTLAMVMIWEAWNDILRSKVS